MAPEEAQNVSTDNTMKYMMEYGYLTEKLVSGKEATDLMTDFWEKLAYIEYQYAKSIAQLCHSRYGRLQKMFHATDKTTEYFRPLQSVWGALIEDLVTHSEAHLNVAYTLQREVKPALARFSQEELSKQVEVAQHGKKVIIGLKDDQAKLNLGRRKLYKTLLAEGKPPSEEEGKDAVTEAAKEKDQKFDDSAETFERKQVQKLQIRTRDSHAHTYNVTMPSILEELNTTSVRRVEEVCSAVGHFTSLITSTNTPFTTTSSTLLAAQTAARTICYNMKTSPPPLPELERAMSRDEMLTFCQTPAKKFLNNIQGMFATTQGIQGMFTMSKTESEPAGGPPSPLDNPLRDISQRVSNLLTTLRTRTLSGHLVEVPPGEDELMGDEKMLDAGSDDVMIDTCQADAPEASIDPPDDRLQEKDMILALSPDSEEYVVVDE